MFCDWHFNCLRSCRLEQRHFRLQFCAVRILSIDTSTRSGGVAVLEDGSIMDHIFERSDEAYSSRLFRSLDLLLSRLGLNARDFDLYAVAAGPGSFTGLRVGLTAVKAWAELYGKPIAAVSGLEAIAAQSTALSGCIAAAMDARRGQVFGALYRAGDATGRLELVGEEILASASEFAAETVAVAPNESVAFITPTPELLLPTVLAAGLRPARVERASDDLAPWIGKIGLRQFERGETVDALSLDANYVRRCDAEVYWKQSK